MERLPAGLPLSRGCRRAPFSALCRSSFISTTYLIVLSPRSVYSRTIVFYIEPFEGIPDQLALQSDLTKLQQWADLWGMQFNPGKCTILTISHGTPKYQKFYTLCGQILQHSSEAKYLGVTLSSDLQWSKHIQDITSKCSSTLGLLRRNLPGCPIKLREQAGLHCFDKIQTRVLLHCVGSAFEERYQQRRSSAAQGSALHSPGLQIFVQCYCYAQWSKLAVIERPQERHQAGSTISDHPGQNIGGVREHFT